MQFEWASVIFSRLSGPSGWSVKYDRFGSIYTTIYLHYIYSDAHTVDTSIYTAKLIDLSNTSIHVDTSETFCRPFGPPTITWPRVNFKTKDRFAGNQVMFTWRPGYQTQRSVTPGIARCLVWTMLQIQDKSHDYLTSNNLKMVQRTTILTMADQ